MTTTTPPTTLNLSDLIFANTTNDSSINKILSDLKRSDLSIHNRLSSIAQDAAFATSVAAAYDLPLIANERCGSWYIAPSQKAGSAYFKSTDGHMSQWSFSLRRLNLQVLDIIAEKGGCILVDTTRRGKSMPDALSKTLPIWSTVLNRILFPDQPSSHTLSTPPTVVGASEHSQIASLIPSFVSALSALHLDLAALRAKLTKPLRPIWITPSSPLPPQIPHFDDFYPVVCCTVSRRVEGSEGSEGGYVQGAADDSEAWACGLTAPLFWAHKAELLATAEEELPAKIAALVGKGGVGGPSTCMLVKPTSKLFLGTIEGMEPMITERDVVVTVGPTAIASVAEKMGKEYLHLKCPVGKVGSRQLRHELPKLLSFLRAQLLRLEEGGAKIMVACETGRDHSVGVALAILCLFVNDKGGLKPRSEVGDTPTGLNKQIIKQRLSWISVSQPDANPSRTTLQSVNAFLLG